MPNSNLPSTFITASAPTTNFSTISPMYVGTVSGLGVCTGLLQTAGLPAGNPWVSAILRLVVNTKTGLTASTVNVQKVTSPSPLNTSTVTYNTPVTVDSTVQATRSIATSDVGTPIQIDLTSLINSWYTTPFPGLALTCTDGSSVGFNSSAAVDPATRPQLILTGNTPPTPDNVNLVGRQVDAFSETLPATPSDAFSTPQDISQKRQTNFFVFNQGTIAAAIGVQTSMDGTHYISQTQTALASGATGAFAPTTYAKYARLYFHSNDISLPTVLVINYLGQT